jgi:prophage maintenance system killer protein
MTTKIIETQNLLQKKADLQVRLKLMAYDGFPEVKEVSGKKYLYVRKRIGSRLTSTYVDVYSLDLFDLLLRNAKESKELRKQIRHIDKDLAVLGYQKSDLSPRVVMNIDFARSNLKEFIYDQVVLEGIATSFPQTEEIIDNGKVVGVTASDVQKILNLKHAWEFILDSDVLQFNSNYEVLCHIAQLINEGFFTDGGRIRAVPVTIGGSTYKPPLPIESVVKEQINHILNGNDTVLDRAIKLCLFTMKTQVFKDGNKRSAIIFANHFLISHGEGLIVVPEKNTNEFKKLLIAYYEGSKETEIKEFFRSVSWRQF